MFEQRARTPALLVEWQPWWPQFLNNIADIFRPPPPELQLMSKPGEVSPDYFVERPLPWKDFGHSGFLHAAAILFIFTTGRFWLTPPQTVLEDPYQHTTLSYYKVDDLLPALKSAPAPRKQIAQKGQPEFAKQQIISVPAAADNSTQTIINPPHPEILHRDVPLPNIVVSTATPAVPTLALTRSQITFPALAVTPVQPAPNVRNEARRMLAVAAPEVVQPAFTAEQMKPTAKVPDVALAEPAPPVEAPKLPTREAMPTQNALAQQEVVPPPPPSQNLGDQRKPAGQLLALSVRPSPPEAEIKVPDASRSGIFAATPDGKIGAPGTPDIAASNSDSDKPAATGAPSNSATGISIAGPRTTPGTATAVVSGPAASSSPKPPSTSQANRTIAAAHPPPSFADIARRETSRYTPPENRKPEDQVFGSKRIYSMQLNMPNLTSAGGSWIIRFAELNQDFHAGELSTPVATNKVDPAYPAELMREHVEGTVILYAVIHADGTVGEVRVLQGFHDKLDENARVALTRWHFRPATKNGSPVDLEAVVQIPFKTRRTGF